MILNLLIDGNFLLSKNVFTLHKNNLLFGSLYRSIENSVNNYRKLYPFANIYFVSDSKEKSWRKKILPTYKATRKKDNDIDWEFVYKTYDEFKDKLPPTVKVFESPHLEGDDWLAFLVDKSNERGISTIIVSNDYDISQKISYSINPLYINIMINEIYNKEKVFLPKNYQIFLTNVYKLPNDDIFNLNDNYDFLQLLDRFINRYNVNEIDPIESLMIKIISGDVSDNINSVWSIIKNGKKRGIGAKGAKTIYDEYITEFGQMDLHDKDLYENIADLICEKKKLSKTQIEPIVENIKYNMRLIDLRIQNLPKEVINVMEKYYKTRE